NRRNTVTQHPDLVALAQRPAIVDRIQHIGIAKQVGARELTRQQHPHADVDQVIPVSANPDRDRVPIMLATTPGSVSGEVSLEKAAYFAVVLATRLDRMQRLIYALPVATSPLELDQMGGDERMVILRGDRGNGR